MSIVKEFEKTEEELFYGFLERYPIMGTRLGLHQYDDLMPEGSLAAMNEHLDFMKKSKAKLEAFKSKSLPEDKALDRDVGIYQLDLMLFFNDELKVWECMPSAPDIVGESIYHIFARDYAPFRDRLRSITKRLEKSPKYIEDSKEQITRPVKLWVDITIDSTTFLPGLFDIIIGTAKDKVPERDIKTLVNAIEATKNSFSEYKDWLTDLSSKAKEDYVLSDEQFAKLLRLRKINLSAEEILAIGKDYYEREKKKIISMLNEQGLAPTPQSVRDLLGAKHPKDFEETIAMYRKSIEDSKKFVIKEDLATMPPDEELIVMETPSYLAHVVPFAAYMSPAKFDKTKTGIYLVTPPLDEKSAAKHNLSTITNTTVHEGYPGHHLQLTCANTHDSMIRLVTHAIETTEGWAHYCEELMLEKGYKYDNSQVSQAVDALWRAARVIIDVNLSTGKMSFDEAVNMLVNDVGIPRKEAEGEIKRYTKHPSYNISYLLGKHLIKELKGRIAKRMGSKFSEKFFHDTILYSGSLPIAFFDRVFDAKLKDTKL